MAETAIEKNMRVLGISRAEAEALVAYDKAVDKGEKTEYDLTAEQKAVEKKMRQADRTPTAYKFTKRERKKNTVKADIIAKIFTFLVENVAENAEITNEERQIAFKLGENDYELTLIQKRKPK